MEELPVVAETEAQPRDWSVGAALLTGLAMVGLQVLLGVLVGAAAIVAEATGLQQGMRTWVGPAMLTGATGLSLLPLWLTRERTGRPPLWAGAELAHYLPWSIAAAFVATSTGANYLRAVIQPDLPVPELNQMVVGLAAQQGLGSWVPLALMAFGMVILAPVTEEWFFRGILQPALARRWGPWVAIGVTAILFALLHDWSAWWVTSLYGVAFGLMAHFRRTLTLSILAHAAMNGFFFLMMVTGAR